MSETDFSQSIFLKACRGERPEITPIWLMRQAGRYQPRYRALKEKHSFLELCSHPELIAEVTLIPFEYAPFDAAIIFSDITIPLRAVGVDFTIEENVGPVMTNPLLTVADIDKLQRRECAEALPYVFEGIKLVRQSLKVPLIGFAAAPFTLASYLMAGKAGRENANARRFMYSEPQAWDRLMRVLVDVSIDYLTQQVKAGAQALQVFDSWVGELSPAAYNSYLLSHMQRLFGAISKLNVPLIHFGTGTALLLKVMSEAGGDVIGADWRTPLTFAHSAVGNKTVMGNLDPAALLSPWEAIQSSVESILEEGRVAPAHIFNLGHGILPKTPVENVQRLVDFVHQWRASGKHPVPSRL
jgi:uroporphyrinogen decarboxylase